MVKIIILFVIFLLCALATWISYETRDGAMPLGAMTFYPSALFTVISLASFLLEIFRRK